MQFYAAKSIINVRILLVVGIIILGAYALLEYDMNTKSACFVVLISLCSFLFASFLVTLCSTLYEILHNVMISATLIAFFGGLVFLNLEHNTGYAFREVIPIVILPHTLHSFLGISFLYSASLCWILQAGYSITMSLFYGIHSEFIALNIYMLASNLLASVTNYEMEDRNRRDFIKEYEQKCHKGDAEIRDDDRLHMCFLTSMIRDLRIPIQGLWQNIQDVYDSLLDDTQRYHVKAMRDCTQTLMFLSYNLVQVSNKQGDILQVENSILNICEIVEEAVEVVSTPASLKELKVSSFVCSNIPDSVIGDAGKLRQILLSLLGNALKFTFQGTIHVDVSTVTETEVSYCVAIKIKDTGSGIQSADMPYVMDRFRQPPKRSSLKEGLGLALVYHLAKLMGGELDVSSTFGVGSSFQVTIPFTKFDPRKHTHVPTALSSPPSLPRPPHPTPTRECVSLLMKDGVVPLNVLVVDSSEESRAAINSYIRDASPRLCVDAVSSSHSCIEFCTILTCDSSGALHILSQQSVAILIIVDWTEAPLVKLLTETDLNTTLSMTQIIYVRQERSPFLSDIHDVSSRVNSLRLPLRRTAFVRALHRAANSFLFGPRIHPDEADSTQGHNESKISDGTTYPDESPTAGSSKFSDHIPETPSPTLTVKPHTPHQNRPRLNRAINTDFRKSAPPHTYSPISTSSNISITVRRPTAPAPTTNISLSTNAPPTHNGFLHRDVSSTFSSSYVDPSESAVSAKFNHHFAALNRLDYNHACSSSNFSTSNPCSELGSMKSADYQGPLALSPPSLQFIDYEDESEIYQHPVTE